MKRGSNFLHLLFVTTLALGLSACMNAGEKKADQELEASQSQIQSQISDASLELEHYKFPYESWKVDNSHQKLTKGQLLVDDKPVVGAVIQVSNKRKTTTDTNGEFSILLDTNMIGRDIVHVASLDEATIDDKALTEELKKELLSLEQELMVYFPIEIDKVEENKEDNSLVDVFAHAVLKENEEFPKFGVEKFPIKGTIKDANGNPVEGATVNIRRDGVEGFSMSDPSNENGEYAMYYIPEDDENHYLNVYVPSENITYTLPEGKAFLFPDDFGIKLDIVLPEAGTIIKDEPPTLVATDAKGALYKGVLIGLNTPDNVTYSITVPQRDGSYVVTLPKNAWDGNPSFYQINYRGFSEHEINLGDTLPSDFIPLPEINEPNQISATQ
ncbi:Ig-like domain-containing protein [Bacillus sp. JJ1562]|uniref:Ig-like domain-containing protein n=1 Tax=Bacillus sp. JJ1562 TaxID=3122960 RepID=UPI00300272B2